MACRKLVKGKCCMNKLTFNSLLFFLICCTIIPVSGSQLPQQLHVLTSDSQEHILNCESYKSFKKLRHFARKSNGGTQHLNLPDISSTDLETLIKLRTITRIGPNKHNFQALEQQVKDKDSQQLISLMRSAQSLGSNNLTNAIIDYGLEPQFLKAPEKLSCDHLPQQAQQEIAQRIAYNAIPFYGSLETQHNDIVWHDVQGGSLCFTESVRDKKNVDRLNVLHPFTGIQSLSVDASYSKIFAIRSPDTNRLLIIIKSKTNEDAPLTLELRDPAKNSVIKYMWGHRFAFSPDSKFLFIITYDTTQKNLNTHKGTVNVYDSTDGHLVTPTYNETCSWKFDEPIKPEQYQIISMANIAQNGLDQAMSSSYVYDVLTHKDTNQSTVIVHNAITGQTIWEKELPVAPMSILFSADNQRVIIISQKHTGNTNTHLGLYQASTGTQLKEFDCKIPIKTIQHVCINRNGRFLLMHKKDQSSELINLDSDRRQITACTTFKKSISTTFSGDGSSIIMSSDKCTTLFDLETKKQIASFEGTNGKTDTQGNVLVTQNQDKLMCYTIAPLRTVSISQALLLRCIKHAQQKNEQLDLTNRPFLRTLLKSFPPSIEHLCKTHISPVPLPSFFPSNNKSNGNVFARTFRRACSWIHQRIVRPVTTTIQKIWHNRWGKRAILATAAVTLLVASYKAFTWLHNKSM